LTDLQYKRFKTWADGDFDKGDEIPENTPLPIDEPTKLPEYLTRAALEHATGGTMYPGIETAWIVKIPGSYDTNLVGNYARPPFRFNAGIEPGRLTELLSLPWQSDFSQCNTHW
jgi:hypothetical protein